MTEKQLSLNCTFRVFPECRGTCGAQQKRIGWALLVSPVLCFNFWGVGSLARELVEVPRIWPRSDLVEI